MLFINMEARCFNFAGGSPAAAYFLLSGQEKVSKGKAAPVRRSFGLPCAARHAGRLRNSPLPLRGKDSDSPRRPLPTRLRYSAAHKGRTAKTIGNRRSTGLVEKSPESRRAAQTYRGKSASTV